MQIVLAVGQISDSFNSSGETIPQNTMITNTIQYDNATDFSEGVYLFTMQGMKFTANGSELTITITGY
jgi:hypothetical protein